MQNENKPNKLQLRIDIILTVLFLLMIFFFGIMTAVTNAHGIYRAAVDRKTLEGYLGGNESPSLWDTTAARIQSVDSYIAQNVYGATQLGYFNSSVQYAMGKRLISTGSANMVTLNSGHLYDLSAYVSMDTAVSDILDMQAIAGDTPFLFVYEHPTVYEDSQMPDGYDVLDYAEEMADEVTSRLSDAGVTVMDSRDVLTSSGLAITDYLMYTDQHWATRAAIVMAQEITASVSEATGIALDPTLLNIENFNTATYEKLFLGKYGQRIGTGNIDPDDITIYWPTYDTDITRHTVYLKKTFDESGAFKDSVIRWQYLEPDKGRTYNLKAYFDYGLTENYDIFTNPGAPDITVLVLKDSYSAGIASFMSLTCGKVVSVDMRRSDRTLQECIDEYQPDMVVVAYSLQMLKQDEYAFQ